MHIQTPLLLLASATTAFSYSYVPIEFAYGVDSRFTANLTLGTGDTQKPIKVVMDTGSANFWVWQPDAVVRWGSQYLGGIGPCNVTVPTLYDPSASSTAVLTNRSSSYSYAGNAKIVQGVQYANDTLTAPPPGSTFPDVQVALENLGTLRILDDGSCVHVSYDLGIMGLSPNTPNSAQFTTGPLFRTDMLAAGTFQSQTMFMWMDRYTAPLGEAMTGGILFDAIDTSKYTGELRKVASSVPAETVGPYVSRPNVTLGAGAGQSATVKPDQDGDCLVDSGAHADVLSFSYDGAELATFFNTSGLVQYADIFSYNGTCESIPADLNITYAFAAATAGDDDIVIDIPLRNFARGYNFTDPEAEGLCLLNLEYGQPCVLGATFLTGAAMVLDDANGGSIAFAQGGISASGSGVDETALKVIGQGQAWDST